MHTTTLQTRLPEELTQNWRRRLEWWSRNRGTARLWSRDAGLWTSADEADWLGWLEPFLPASLREGLRVLAGDVQERGIRTVVLVGMGGSALGAEALYRTIGASAKAPKLVLLDTTDPRELERALEHARSEPTLVISASKSGSTLETRLVTELLLEHLPPECFVAVTDPGSVLRELAREAGFAHTFEGTPGIGGRFSVLSPFGLVPAACLGFDVDTIVGAATEMAKACRRRSPDENPGASLGCLLAASLEQGRDKLTIVCSEPQRAFSGWLEQLIAESTGKGGAGMLPIVGEGRVSPSSYGADRLFLHLVDDSAVSSRADSARLSAAGQPIARIPAATAESLGGELYRWMFATSVLGACMAIHPFDQPDVEASKQKTRGLIDRLRNGETLELRPAALSTDSLEMVAGNVALPDGQLLLDDLLGALVARARGSDYLAVLAYLPREPEIENALERLRSALFSKASPTTITLGWGPRYLHSTGQLFKGGPTTGRFLLLTADRNGGPKVPGEEFGFEQVQLAQALGDVQVLRSLGKPVLWARLRGTPATANGALVTANGALVEANGALVKAIETMVEAVERLTLE